MDKKPQPISQYPIQQSGRRYDLPALDPVRPREAETTDPNVYDEALRENALIWEYEFNLQMAAGKERREAAYLAGLKLAAHRKENPFPWLKYEFPEASKS